MCLAIPGKILAIDTRSEMRMGTVSFGGIEREVCLDLTPEAAVGEYVVVHVGFAISILNEAEALASLELFKELDAGREDSLPAATSQAVDR